LFVVGQLSRGRAALIRGIVTDRGPDFDHATSVARVRQLRRGRSCATIEAMELFLENLPPSLRDHTDAIRECLLAFDKVMPLRAVYLFGSHARGDARADSDVDLCLVSDGAGIQLDAAAKFRRATRDIRPKPSFTLVPITPARLKEKQERGDHFFQTVLREGRRLGA
jgi:uncharacterized protein